MSKYRMEAWKPMSYGLIFQSMQGPIFSNHMSIILKVLQKNVFGFFEVQVSKRILTKNICFCNLFIYQARQSLAWSQHGFWRPTFSRKRNLWRLCFDWRTKVKFLCIAAMEKKKSGEKSKLHDTSPFLQGSNE